MMNRTLLLGFVFAALVATTSVRSQPDERSSGRALSADARAALFDALAGEEGEYAERAKYAAIVERFGQVQPYLTVRASENYHVAAIESQLKRYGVSLPEDRYAGKVQAPATLNEAAIECIRAEERNIALYERLIVRLSQYPDLVRIFQNLQRSSREGHLAAFKAASANGGKLTPEQMRTYMWRGRRQGGGDSRPDSRPERGS